MEEWRKQLYTNELYHYGVKGMKWGKHLKLGLREFWNRDVTGNAWLRDALQYRQARDQALREAHMRRPLSAKERQLHPEHTEADRKRMANERANYLHEAARIEKGRMSLLKAYKNTSLKGMAEDKLQKGRRWLQNTKVKSIAERKLTAGRNWLNQRRKAAGRKLNSIKRTANTYKKAFQAGYQQGSGGKTFKQSFQEGYAAGQARARAKRRK